MIKSDLKVLSKSAILAISVALINPILNLTLALILTLMSMTSVQDSNVKSQQQFRLTGIE